MKKASNNSFGAYRPHGRIAHIKGPENATALMDHLSLELPSSKEEDLKFLVDLGAVYVNKKRMRDPNHEVMEGDLIRVHLEPKRYTIDKELIAKTIVFENENFVILNKPSGVPMHATLDNALENLAASFDKKLFVTHRLDVPTSGVVLLAKNKNYQAVFNELISQRKIKKTYQTLTLKKTPVGPHKHYMIVSDRAPKKLLTEQEFLAIVNYEPLDECLLEVLNCDPVEFDIQHKVKTLVPGFSSKINLVTGRTHQIRAQLSALGCPIVGDEMYGGMPAPLFGLHACSLEFTDPVSGQSYNFKSDKTWA